MSDLERAGSLIYVGGSFERIGGRNRKRLAAVDAETGALDPWNPDVGTDRYYSTAYIRDLLASGERLYVGGEFGAIHERAHSGFAVFGPLP